MARHLWLARVPLRYRIWGVVAASVVCLFVTYRSLWHDISSPFPYTPWSQSDYGGSWTKTTQKSSPLSTPWQMPPTASGNIAHEHTAEMHAALIVSESQQTGGGGGAQNRLGCPSIDVERYAYLRNGSHGQPPNPNSSATPIRAFYFALDLRQVVDLLPTLLGSILKVIRFLGPNNCVLSIVEGRSTDGTYETLLLLRETLTNMGAVYYLQRSDINPRYGDRIGKLAKLRNLALEPMMTTTPTLAAENDVTTTILFLNDVAVCAEDILELVHQKLQQGADMACAMDYERQGRRFQNVLSFYDVWVARSMDGNSFYEVPGAGQWGNSQDLFPHDAPARSRHQARLPFQVFACWNGAAAISATPFLRDQLEFRRAMKHRGECGAGEPTLLCKDLWNGGHGKILVVPSISVGYTVEEGLDVKKTMGYTSNWTAKETKSGGDVLLPLRVDWITSPPEMVRCIPSWRKQFWQTWNRGVESEGKAAP